MSAGRFLQQAAAGAGGSSATYAEDVFSTYVYNGNGGARSIYNGILLGDGPKDYTAFHLTGESMTDSAPLSSGATLANNIGASISTAEKKYGSGSIQFTKSSNGYVRSDSRRASPRGDEDFTIEAWINISGSHTNYNFIYGHSYPQQFFVDLNGYVNYYTSSTDSSSGYVNLSSSSTVTQITTGTWTHVAVTRRGSLFTIWVDGVESGTTFSSAQVALNETVFPTVGNWSTINTTYAFNGYIDDFRITRGLARYTANFTPPAEALPVDSTVSGEGGMVWIKGRSNTGHGTIFDTERGVGNFIMTGLANAESSSTTGTRLTSFNSNGFSLGTDPGSALNFNGYDYASWTFRKQPGFFDVVTYTGTGSAQNISHSLGTTPGMIIVKNRTDSATNWIVYHRRSNGGTNPEQYSLLLNSTNAQASVSGDWNNTAPTDTQFTVGNQNRTNGSGDSFVAYLFAHDAQDFGTGSDESIIKCGSYTGTGSAQDIDLGFEPQWILIKRTNTTASWILLDSMRGIAADTNDPDLHPNDSNYESQQGAVNFAQLNADGIKIDPGSNGYTGVNSNGSTYIYVAIRRPHKPAEEFAATDLFAMDTGANTAPGLVSDFPTDFSFSKEIIYSNTWYVGSRLQGQKYMGFAGSSAENTRSAITWDYMNGFMDSSFSGEQGWMFRRAPGFFDVVAYTGTGGTGTHTHNLGVVPELMIVKGRSVGSNWAVYAAPLGNTQLIELDGAGAARTNSIWGNTTPTDSVATIGGAANLSGSTYIAYLFATVPGISKVGSYTGTGSDVDVDCGFTSGARLVWVKRTDSTGEWYAWDTERGIVAGNDSYLFLNSNAAQVTSTDYIDPLSSGFTITSSAPAALNTSGGNYIFLAIA